MLRESFSRGGAGVQQVVSGGASALDVGSKRFCSFQVSTPSYGVSVLAGWVGTGAAVTSCLSFPLGVALCLQ